MISTQQAEEYGRLTQARNQEWFALKRDGLPSAVEMKDGRLIFHGGEIAQEKLSRTDLSAPYIFLHPNEYEAAKREGHIYKSGDEHMCVGGKVRVQSGPGTAVLTVDEYEARKAKRAPKST